MKVDPADLLTAREVADVLGLKYREAIATYRKRYKNFPEPIVTKGTCVLWDRRDIEAWSNGPRERKPGSK